jgi:C1A family cysteine protease/peptidoglycan hydrolase-like protein with peptidoglycan-binding domain
MSEFTMNKKGLGWVPDYPDIRDYRLENEKIKTLNGEQDLTTDQLAIAVEVLSKLKRHSKDPLLQQEIENLNPLNQAIQKEINQKISFRSASFAYGVLAYGCQGKAVYALKQKLKTLRCYCDESDSSDQKPEEVFYDRSLEDAVKTFQQQQKLKVTGVATAVTLAKIAALASIATQAQRSLYLSSGDIGPGVIYLQQKLLTLNPELVFKTWGEFGQDTREAVIAFQKTVFEESKEQDGIVGPKTGGALNKHFQHKLVPVLTAPIARTRFDQIAAHFLKALNQKEHRDKLFPDIYPLIDVVAQLLPFLAGYDQQAVYALLCREASPQGSSDELRKALLSAYKVVENYRLKGDEKQKDLPDRLILIAERLRNRRGYFPSREIDTVIYGRKESAINEGAAIIYIQERLRNLEFYKAPTTGYFEELTEAAVKEFQRCFVKMAEPNGQFDDQTKAKLNELDRETVRLLDAPTPDVFFTATCEIIQVQPSPQDKSTKSAILSIVPILMQMMMPVAKQIDLEAAIRDSFEQFKAIAQYTLIAQAIREVQKEPDYESFLPNKAWRIFQTAAHLEQSQRIFAVMQDQTLLDRFEAPIAIILRSLPKQSEIVKLIYATLQDEVEDIRTTLKAPQSLTLAHLTPIRLLIGKIEVLLDRIFKDPTALEVVQLRQAREPTFIRLDRTGSGNLYASVNGKFAQKLNDQNTGFVHLALPEAVDLSFWCSPIEDQGKLNACTAHAGIALVEYFERKSLGQYINASRRFLYKTARNLMQREGDSGASMRETMKAMVLFGVPPEEYWSYDETEFDAEPSAFCYAYAQNYQTIRYFRLDDTGLRPDELLAQIKLTLVAGFPCMFGFTVYDSLYHPSNLKGVIPYPTQENKREGGHSVVAVGYDDYKQIKNSTGAILIRNSWGVAWGDRGYGWLPYDYVLNGLARDWWSLIKAEWVETGSFGLGSTFDWSAIGVNTGITPQPNKK